MAAELLARYALHQFGLDPEMLRFDHTGRPCVSGDAAYLSLSHSGEYVACAVSDAPVGVDIQEIRPVNRLVIARVCTPAEQNVLHDSEDVPAAFTRLWSLKEAWRKANPDSSTREMLRAEFFVSESGEVRGPSGFRYTLLDEPEGYCLALCETETERNFPIHEATQR
jgi:phosphopantetheinyl transferase